MTPSSLARLGDRICTKADSTMERAQPVICYINQSNLTCESVAIRNESMIPSPNSKLRVGVIGAGTFAETGHLPGLQSHPQAKVVAICGRRYDHARSLADRFNIPDVHTDYHELCARSDLDAVTIVTSSVEHAKQAITALESGKHVFCEKPMAMTVTEAHEMVRAAE